jgi:NAD(P)-dependent dehydrogenase (short-subunit alcohol dehydrogenase family)
MKLNFDGKVVLVTGGTKGIGLATALAFGAHGAQTVLTYRWGSADEDDVRRRFSAAGAPDPLIVQADVSQPGETAALMDEIARRHASVDVFVSNAAGGVLVKDIADLTERALLKTIRYGSWPMFDHIFQIHRRFGAYPRYAVAVSSTGPDRFSINYDLVAASKAALETLCRYLSHRLMDQDIRINVVRTIGVLTDAFHTTFGPEASAFFLERVRAERFVSADEVAGAILALCSGRLDGMRGQTLTVDHGAGFFDSAARLYAEQAQAGI